MIFTLLAGILQIPLVEPAALTNTFFGKVGPMLASGVFILVKGTNSRYIPE
jgi:hypothetical protein